MANNILIIDDIESNVDSMIEILASKGYSVERAVDYQSALDILLTGFPQIFLINSTMLNHNSYELYEKLKENEKAEGISAVFYSSKDDSLEKLKAFRLGAVDYISEPFYIEELLARLNTHLSIGALQKNLIWTKKVLENTSVMSRVGGWDFDIVNNKLYWSSITKEIHEVPEDYSASISDAVDFYKEGESREVITKCIADAMKEGKSYDVELKIITAKGNEIWVRAIGDVQTENGEVTKLYGTFQNIDDAKKYKLTLQKSESSLREAEKVSKSGSWEWNELKDQLYWSEGLYNILKIDVETEPDWNLFLDKAIINKFENSNLSREEVAERLIGSHEFEFDLGKGVYKCFETIGRKIEGKDGSHRYVGTIMDITAKKMADLEYEQLSRRFQLSFEVANIAICQVDIEGHFKMVNDSATKFFGYSSDELIGRHFDEITHTEDVDEGTSYLDFAANSIKHQLRYEKRYIQKDGSTVWGEVSSSFVKGDTPDKSFFITYILDITARKEAENVLHQYKNIVYSSSDILALVDTNFNYVIVNKSYADAFNMDHSEPSNYSVPEVCGRVMFESLVKPAAQRALNGEQVILETWTNLANKGVCYMEIKFSPHLDQSGKIQGYVVDGRDITEKKKSKDRLRALTSIQNSFIGNASIKQSFSQMLDVLLELTQSSYGFIGEVGERDGKPVLKTQVISDAAWNSETKDAYEKNAPLGMEFANMDTLFGKVILTGQIVISNDPKDAGQEKGALHGHPELDCFIGLPFYHNGKLMGMVGMANKKGGYSKSDTEILEPFLATCSTVIKAYQDARKKEKIEKELLQLADIVSYSNDAIISTDLNLNVISWNEGAEKMLGYTAEEMLGSSVIPLKPRSTGNLHDVLVQKVQAGDFVESMDTIQLRKDGTEVNVNMSMFPLKGEGGEVKGVSSILRDITVQKEAIEMKEKFTRKLEVKVSERTAELLKAKAELATSLQNEKVLGELKSRFVATASHQFRTPLTVIQSNMSVLAMQMQKLDDDIVPSFDKAYSRIKRQISRMTSLMDDVLILGKINAGRIKAVFEPVDLVEICNEIVGNYNEIQTDGQVVEFEMYGPQEKINLDPKLLEHIISNLVSNAIKYSIGSRSPILSLNYDDEKVAVKVKDFGIGIPKEDVNHLFEPFYRASNVEDITGTGLGSTIAKEYAELIGGQISVKSTINEGSEFTVEFNTHENGKFISS